jgi:VanZ family protein
MRLLFVWMALITLFSSIPDLSMREPLAFFQTSHDWFITNIEWSLLLSWDNPFLSIPKFKYLGTVIHKIGHVLFFSVLGWLAFRALRSVKKSLWLCLLFILFDELHQAFVPGRGSRLFDIALDLTVAVPVILLASRYYNRSPKKKPALPS